MTTTNAEYLRQYKRRFSLIIEQMVVFALNPNLVSKLGICLQISKELLNDVLHNSHSVDRSILS